MKRRDTLILVVGSIAVCILLGVAVSSLIKSEYSIFAIDTSAALCISVLLLFYRFSPFKQQCCYVGVAFMYGLYAYLFFTGAAGGHTYMWHYTFPFFATFLIGANHGAIATLFLFLPVFIGVVMDALSPGTGLYSSDFAIRFIPSVSIALIFSFLFERERERSRQQALDAYREQERIIEERTRQLKKETEDREKIAIQLRQSQKMEALGVMAGGVAHDLNNILAGVVSYPELIRLDLPADSTLHEPLETIEKAGKRAAAVVEDLLTLARNAASVKEAVNLNSLIGDFLQSPEWQRMSKSFPSVTVSVNLASHISPIYCSQVHVRKCLMNLLHNGIEVSAPNGKVTLTTGQSVSEDLPENFQTTSDSATFFSIHDSGPGIDKIHLDHIFEPFYTTKKMGHSGSGLGLSVVWSTIEDHEGYIEVENTGKGARFTVWLPSATAKTKDKQAIKQISLESLQGTGAILLVDDEPELREIGSQTLKRLGYDVRTASSGEEAVNCVRERHFDLIILDMLLGEGMDGGTTYQEILHISPTQKAIITTGYSTGTDVQKTLKLGAHSLIKKPYNMEELGLAIQRCLQETT